MLKYFSCLIRTSNFWTEKLKKNSASYTNNVPPLPVLWQVQIISQRRQPGYYYFTPCEFLASGLSLESERK